MSIPDYQTIMLPLLECLKDKKMHKISDLIEKLTDEFKLTDEEREKKYENGKHRIFSNRVRWARLYLKKAGLVKDPERGYLIITNQGIEALILAPPKIDSQFLKRYPEFIDKKSKKDATGTSEYMLDSEKETLEKDTPDELIQKAFDDIKETLELDLLNLLRTRSPKFFETAVSLLLESMGYGKAVVTGKKGDGGIDGVLYHDELGLETIVFQAKRYAENNIVNASMVRDFLGGIDEINATATKGVFITTSRFTPDARKIKSKTKILKLIDGDELVKLMIDYEIGVNVYDTYKLKKINQEFFTEEE